MCFLDPPRAFPLTYVLRDRNSSNPTRPDLGLNLDLDLDLEPAGAHES